MKIFTLVFVMSKSQILLGLKKRGLGEGKWNGFGGKVELNEIVIQGAVRELREESGVVADECNLLRRGVITMYFENGDGPFLIHVFQCNEWKGEITETEEMKPQWFDIDRIPYDLMWSEARLWYPVFLSGCSFEASFSYDTKGDIIEHVINRLP
ncbi:oxidized purine nucleoside triphosphate hydrolase-like [Daphnia carinata]|uniref:oxidized purine nucleoside triphosphate hydrolase-like n=1 Tax=Daphnia carinata TaxID=120202 RepID=UPI00257BE4D4|nr:oxidized purine nucleoside triphosphate hydrolase-like [Daphnia carinata]